MQAEGVDEYDDGEALRHEADGHRPVRELLIDDGEGLAHRLGVRGSRRDVDDRGSRSRSSSRAPKEKPPPMRRVLSPRPARAVPSPAAAKRGAAGTGAATSVLLAASPLLDGVTGRYCEGNQEARIVRGDEEGRVGGVAAHALDPETADRLWE
ncbi:hypothetical protein Shyd_87570 [Streptomyces hydrogenans]|uniref:Uncharacterized protein n=1 Tax=Streptomyces hydrogenans TaxID=1873719 RepID=A0ABQ3PQT9_9ACTN|nr:hypothetical protein GCM10018784_07850 [Streptomyces hydrogenans]GHI27386.1 hypothetical protein Shyd_87570 [Streptomyces hydrogenans]